MRFNSYMNVHVPKIKVVQELRVPYKYIRGSESERFALSNKYTNDLFLVIKNLYTHNKTAVSNKTISDAIQSILPKELNIRVCKINDEIQRQQKCIGTIYLGSNDNVKGEMIINEIGILMPMKGWEQIAYNNVWILLHEFRHVMDYVTNPKFIFRNCSCSCICKIDNKNITEFYAKFIHNNRKKFNLITKIKANIELRKLMNNLSDEDRINILQQFRYIIKSEINAYSNVDKYQSEINNNLSIVQDIKSDSQILSEFDYESKLDYFNKVLYYKLKKIRLKQKKLQNIKTE